MRAVLTAPAAQFEWDNTLADLAIGVSKPEKEGPFVTTGEIMPLFEIAGRILGMWVVSEGGVCAGLTTFSSKIGCGDRFTPEAMMALTLLSDLFDEDVRRVLR